MKILIIGNRGNMGRRYKAILDYLNVKSAGCDIEDIPLKKPRGITHAIIATPIDTHYYWCLWCIENKINFLCEKPISKYIEEIKTIKNECEKNGVDGRMVCNWKYLKGISRKNNVIKFNYFNTGKDGFFDLIQPVYISSKFTFKNTSPIYDCEINGFYISQIHFDLSYIRMIKDWVRKNTLWSIADAIDANKKLLQWEKNGRLPSYNTGS